MWDELDFVIVAFIISMGCVFYFGIKGEEDSRKNVVEYCLNINGQLYKQSDGVIGCIEPKKS